MITKMKKISFIVLRRGYEDFLNTLRSQGVIHVVERQHGQFSDSLLQDRFKLISKYQTVIEDLKRLQPSSQESDEVTVEQIIELYDSYMVICQQQEQQLQMLERDRQQLQVWGDFSYEPIEQLRSAGYLLRFFTSPIKDFKEEWRDSYNAIEISSDRQNTYFVTLTHESTIVDIEAEESHLPSLSLSQIEKRIAQAKSDIEAKREELQKVSSAAIRVLRQAKEELEDSIEFDRVRLSGETVAEDNLTLLQGWIPADKVPNFEKSLEKKTILYEIEDPTPLDDIPIQLKNGKFAKLFEPLTKLYMLPTYQELDLTLFFAPFFMIFFGLCLGDIGYGLLMIVGLPIFTQLFKLINPHFSKWLVLLFGASTILCGTLSGNFFGFSIYSGEYFSVNMESIAFLQRMKELLYVDNSTMFTVSLCIGVVQILFGMLLKVINLTIQCGIKSAISTIGWLVLLLTVIVAALVESIGFNNPIVVTLLAISAVSIFLLNSPGKNPLLNIGLGLWDTYNMATGLLGDVLSYVRLFALGLSGGILASVFNSMAEGMSPDVPIVGFLVTALIFIIGHALNIFMNILGAVVHPMRLTFVEFFKNSGYVGGGMEYRPFSGKSVEY